MPRLLSLTVSDAPGTWAGLGFTLDAIAVRIGGTAIVCSDSEATTAEGPRGITDWMFSADDGPLPERIDGLLTGSVTMGDALPETPTPAMRHVNGVESIDHLVVMTPDVDRTVAALEDLDIECRRRRKAAAYGNTAMRQAFFWLGKPNGSPAERVILEVVGPEIVNPAKASDPAKFFGLALTCRDLDETAAFFGDLMKPPVDAVQSGRRIATLSSRAGCHVAIALMSPHNA